MEIIGNILAILITVIIFCKSFTNHSDGTRNNYQHNEKEKNVKSIPKPNDNITARNDKWTPIYSGTSRKLIAGVSNNKIYRYEEIGNMWLEIAHIVDNRVYMDDILIGRVDGERIYLDTTEYIDSIINMLKNEPDDFSQNEIKRITKCYSMKIYQVARVASSTSTPCVFIAEYGENFEMSGNQSILHEVIMFAKSCSSEEDTSALNLGAAFLAIQRYPLFDDSDRPIRILWDKIL